MLREQRKAYMSFMVWAQWLASSRTVTCRSNAALLSASSITGQYLHITASKDVK